MCILFECISEVANDIKINVRSSQEEANERTRFTERYHRGPGPIPLHFGPHVYCFLAFATLATSCLLGFTLSTNLSSGDIENPALFYGLGVTSPALITCLFSCWCYIFCCDCESSTHYDDASIASPIISPSQSYGTTTPSGSLPAASSAEKESYYSYVSSAAGSGFRYANSTFWSVLGYQTEEASSGPTP